MHKLIILSKDAHEYRAMIEQAQLPDLTNITQPTADCDIDLCAPTLIRDQFASLPNLKWVQSIWAGVEPLLDSTLRRDHILTGVKRAQFEICIQLCKCARYGDRQEKHERQEC